MKGGMRHRR